MLTGGACWLPRLADELAAADAVLLLVGQRLGPWQELEYYKAQRLSRLTGRHGRSAIVPVIMVEQAPGLPFFDLLHRILAPDPVCPDTVRAVLAAVAGAASPARAPAWKRFNPYKGLPALTATDAAFLFGRDDDRGAGLIQAARASTTLPVLRLRPPRRARCRRWSTCRRGST